MITALLDFIDLGLLKSIVITALVSTMFAFIANYWREKHFLEVKRQASRQRLVAALKTELETLLEIYEPLRISAEPPKDGPDIKVSYLTSTNYTIVYANNTGNIGLLTPPTIKAIVTAYTNIAALMDGLTVYSARWEKLISSQRDGLAPDVIEASKRDVDATHDEVFRQQEKTLAAVHLALSCLEKESVKEKAVPVR